MPKTYVIPKEDGNREEYEYRERFIVLGSCLDVVLEKENGFNEGDIINAISDDLARNNLKAIKLKIKSVGPLIMNHIKDRPKQRIFYSGYFLEVKNEQTTF